MSVLSWCSEVAAEGAGQMKTSGSEVNFTNVRVERVQAVIDGRDPCPPTLIDWLMTLPWRGKPVHRGRADRPPDRRAGQVHGADGGQVAPSSPTSPRR